MTKALTACIRAYQRLSRACVAIGFGPFTLFGCRQWPSCSEYGISAIRRYGPLRGSVRAAVRVIRCNPFAYVH